MNIRRFVLIAGLLLILSLTALPSIAQGNQPLTMLVDTGFDNFYRSGDWFPIQIHVSNDGTGLTGRLTVRPETSGRAVNSAYSVPVDLPTGSDKTIFLYVQAQAPAETLVVELIDDEGVRVNEQAVGISPIHPQDTLHMVISSTTADSLPLNRVAPAGFTSRQGRWEVDNLPPDMFAFEAVDTIILYDVQSDAFTIDQLLALEARVVAGAHLLIIGGPSGAQTSGALSDTFVPFIATGSSNINDVSVLATYIDAPDVLEARTFITTGDVVNDADVLIETDDGLPLLIRREFGAGVVDFLTVDPALEPLRSWEQLQEFWLNVLSDTPPEPGWQRGILESQDAARSLAIMPGVELLPPASTMIAFIVAYILMIGPINYFVLSRIRRRAWAWGTIPLLIVAFTLIAWNAGFNLRGNEVIMSRIFVVQSFPDTDIAIQEELVGVLSPRREIYTIFAPENALMEVLPGVETDSFFSANVTRSTANIVQGQSFAIENVAIDGGIFANFNLSSVITAPDISGNVTIGYLPDERPEGVSELIPTPQSIRGFVRNDSELTLEHVVIMARNRFYRVEGDFEPGDVLDFDTVDFDLIRSTPGTLIPIASPIQSNSEFTLDNTLANRFGINDSLVTSRVLLNLDWNPTSNRREQEILLEFGDEEMSRRRALLRAIVRDQYRTSGLGNQVYVFGWTTQEHAEDLTMEGVSYRPVDTTLHIIELPVELELPPASETITLSADQFTWRTLDLADGQVIGALHELTLLDPAFIEYSFTPYEGAILDEVTSMVIETNRRMASGHAIAVSLWNRETLQWDVLEAIRFEEYDVTNPAVYLGYNNQVNLRIDLNTELMMTSSNVRLSQIRVIQTGHFGDE